MSRIHLCLLLGLLGSLSGCAVITIADAAVSVAATTVKVGASVVGTAVDVTAAGVRAVSASDEKKLATEKLCQEQGNCP